MLPFKSRLLFGVIGKTIGWIFKIIYKALAFLNLQLTLLVLLVGGVLYLTGVIEEGNAMSTVFLFALAISIVVAIISTTNKLLGGGKKVGKSKGAQIISEQSNAPVKVSQEQEENTEQVEIKTSVVPKYFKVKQHPNYLMAEYPDRYELYKVAGGKMIKVRTDLKR